MNDFCLKPLASAFKDRSFLIVERGTGRAKTVIHYQPVQLFLAYGLFPVHVRRSSVTDCGSAL